MADMEMNVPDRWESNKLGAICKIKKGVQFNRIELSDAGMYPCINGGITPSGYSDLWNTEAETITISEGGNSCGYVNYLTSRFWSGGHCYSLLDLKKGLDKGFLYQALKGRESLIMDLRVGSGLPNIQQKAIKEFELLVPESIAEQRQIACVLSKVDEVISQTEQLIVKYRRLKTGLMHDLLTKGIDEHGNIRSQETHAFKDSQLGRIPAEWRVEKLGLVCEKIQDGTHFSPKTDENGKFKYITSKNIRMGYIDLSNVEYLNEIEHQKIYRRCTVLKGDVLLTKDGANTGNICLNNLEDQFSLLSSVAFIRGRKNILINKFIVQFFMNETGQQSLTDQMSGNAIPRITLTKINDTPIIIPPVAEQEVIVERLYQQDNIIEAERRNLAKLNSLKAGLMQDLLSGKVRVEQLIRETAAV